MLLSETLKAQSVYHLEKIDLITAHKYLYGEKKYWILKGFLT